MGDAAVPGAAAGAGIAGVIVAVAKGAPTVVAGHAAAHPVQHPDVEPRDRDRPLRIGQAAELLGVTVDTIRRWEADGRLALERTDGGQRLVPIAEVSRLLAERRRTARDRPIVAQSARTRFARIVTRVGRDVGGRAGIPVRPPEPALATASRSDRP